MTTLTEYKTVNQKVLALSENIVVENLSIQELIELVLDTSNNQIFTASRQELIGRGKDDIKTRILIKKTCKQAISDLEILLKRFESTNRLDEKNLKFYKTRLLNIVSLLDRLQLEWQKQDLVLKK